MDQLNNGLVDLAAGVIIIRDGSILLVYENEKWGLPKGGHERGESFCETAKREAKEETGLDIEIEKLAFVTEFKENKYGHYLQLFYTGHVVGGNLSSRNDPDCEITDVRYVPIPELRRYMKFRPRLISLEKWLDGDDKKYYFYDLDKEKIEV
jgi:ADP-ribose pyrophosphatase YjhB (NUDIX family)